MRVLHCRVPQILGGPEKQILGLMAEGRALGIDQSLVVLSRGGQQASLVVAEAHRRDLDACIVESRGRFDLRPLATLTAMVRDGDFDIICTHGYLPDILGFLVARRLGRRLVSVAHGYTQKSRAVRVYEFIDARLLRRFDYVVAVSDALRDRLLRSGVAPEITTTIRNAVGEAELLPREECRARLGLSPLGFVIGCVGRLSPEKGHRFLLDAAAALTRQGVAATVVICGEGPEMDALRAQSARLELDDALVLAGHRADVESLLGAFDVFVLPSLTEGIPVALLEAAAAGLPAVASNVGGVPEVIADGETGLLVPPADCEALAGAIRQLHDDSELARRLGAAAQARVAREFSREAQALRYREVFSHLVRTGQRGR